MLQNAYLLAKIGADTAENERKFAENFSKFAKNWQLPYGSVLTRDLSTDPSSSSTAVRLGGRRFRRVRHAGVRCCGVSHSSAVAGPSLDAANFRGLVVGCIEAKSGK